MRGVTANGIGVGLSFICHFSDEWNKAADKRHGQQKKPLFLSISIYKVIFLARNVDNEHVGGYKYGLL